MDLSPPPATQTDLRTQTRRKETKDIQCIIMENIHLQSLSKKALCDALLKCVEGCTDPENQKPLDLLILTSLQDIHGKKKVVENILKSKIRNGLLTEALFAQTVVDYTSVIKKYFSNLVSICDTLLRSQESIISNFAIAMYRETFVSFVSGDAYYQQEIVGDLISKVGTGGGGIITDGALRALENLAERHSRELVAFTPMITAMMDFTENMNLGQFRQLMHILCTLAWQAEAGESGSSLQNEVNIMMRKQLCSRSPIIKKMGVIGAVNAVRAMGRSLPTEVVPSSHSSQDSANSLSGRSAAIMKLIDLTIAETRSFPEAAGLFMDELASPATIAEMPAEIAAQCSTRFQNRFEEEFVEDYDKNKSERSDMSLPIKLGYKIEDDDVVEDEEEAGDIAVPISRWVMETRKNPMEARTEMFRFIPHFRLLGAIKTIHADESEIDALLGMYTSLSG